MNRVRGLAMVCLLLAAATLHAAPAQLSAEQARHLLLRTGFAPGQAAVDGLIGKNAGQVVAQIVAAAGNSTPIHAPPEFVNQGAPTPFRLLASITERQEQRREQMRQGLDLKRWWMREMIESPYPLRERMTLFWHNHFATSQQKVVRSQVMWRQHQLLRAHALGNFRALLHAVAKDPAMLVYLDGVNNRKGAPNENFAREVMELFTLGEASQANGYTEQDIKEAARAFTGWSVERDDFSFKFRPFIHDYGNKTVFGRSGNFDGDDVLDLMLDQPGAARFIVAKLWKEFVSPVPEEAQLQRIAGRFVQSGFDIAVVVRELLMTDDFWLEANRGALVKSPIDLVVGTVRQFGVGYSDTTPFVVQSALLGQNLLVPPNVKGWPAYTDWIDASSLLGRKRFAALLIQTVQGGGEVTPVWSTSTPAMAPDGAERAAMRVMAGIRFDAHQWLTSYGADVDREPNQEVKARIAAAVLPVPATQSIAAGTVGLALLRGLMQDAAYQLK